MPLPGEKWKDPEDAQLDSPTKKEKRKPSRLPLKTALTEDDYELIATRMHDTLKESFEAMQKSQEKMQSMVENQLLDLKAISEKTSMTHVPPVRATAAESSTQSISREEILATDCINTVLIPPGGIQFPASMMDAPLQFRQPVEFNLVEFHID